MRHSSLTSYGKLLLGAAMVLAPAAFADTVDVTLNTSALMSGVTGPYYIEFQLVDGDGMANRTVTIDGFQLGAGSASGSPDLFGGASGSIGSGIALDDSMFFNSFFEEFTAGSTLAFRITFNAPTGPVITPDRLTFAILNGSQFEIPTTGPGSELLGIDLRPGYGVELYAGLSGSGDPVLLAPTALVSSSSVPEPADWTLWSIVPASATLAVRGWRQRRRRVS